MQLYIFFKEITLTGRANKVVIPVQFVLFTLSAIIGSAILYGDFKTAKFHQIVTFLYGCAATFLGVFIIAWAPNSPTEDDIETEVADEGDIPNGRSPITNGEGRHGSISRRRRATLILPSGVRDSPLLRQQSNLSLIGLSPAQVSELIQTEEIKRFTTPTSTFCWYTLHQGKYLLCSDSAMGTLKRGCGGPIPWTDGGR